MHPRGIQLMLETYGIPVEGKQVCVIGRGLTIGRPMALLMALKRPAANAAVTVIHRSAGPRPLHPTSRHCHRRCRSTQLGNPRHD